MAGLTVMVLEEASKGKAGVMGGNGPCSRCQTSHLPVIAGLVTSEGVATP